MLTYNILKIFHRKLKILTNDFFNKKFSIIINSNKRQKIMFTTQQLKGRPKRTLKHRKRIEFNKRLLNDEVINSIIQNFNDFYQTDLSPITAKHIITFWFDTLKDVITSGHNLKIPYFGKFGIPERRRYYKHLSELQGDWLKNHKPSEAGLDFSTQNLKFKEFDSTEIDNLLNTI